MADEEGIRRKYVPLAAETRDYSAATAQISSQGFYKQSSGCPSLVLRELADQLSAIETATIRTNLELKAARLEAVEGRESAGRVLERVLASVERLNEVATAITRRLDELLKA